MTTLAAILLLAPHLTSGTAASYAEMITLAAKKHQLNPLLVVALIHHESRFKAKAKSGRNYGLLQVRAEPGSIRGSRISNTATASPAQPAESVLTPHFNGCSRGQND